MSKKTNTLFSYFSKSPKSQSSKNVSNSNQTLTRSKDDQSVTKTNQDDSKKHMNKENGLDESFNIYDIVWAKVQGYPFWPGLVCNGPDDDGNNIYCILKSKGGLKYHIQFFDDPPTRAWVKLKFIKLFDGLNHPDIAIQKDLKWKSSVEKASEAYKKSIHDRQSLVAVFEPSRQQLDKSDGSGDEVISLKRKDDETPKSVKRRRIVQISDDDDSDEYIPSKKDLSEESDDHFSAIDSENETPVKERKSSNHNGTLLTPKSSMVKRKIESSKSPLSDVTRSKLSSFSPTVEQNISMNTSEIVDDIIEERTWVHLTEKFDFLIDKKRKDADGRLSSHPEFNPRTLYVPESFLKTLTPVGKFYELYHMDAVIGVNELGLSFMKGDFAHSGFPEKSYGHFSELLLQKGYKVGRVEQTETPQMMEERCKQILKPSRNDKVVRRELCRVTTRGTRMYSFLEGEAMDINSCYLLALTENGNSTGEFTYGICFIDTSIGKFHLGQFSDDRNCSKLRTLIAHHPPTQVLYEKTMLSQKTLNILESSLSFAIKDALKSGSEFMDATNTLKFLTAGSYFKDENSDTQSWPESLLHFMDPNDPLRQTAKEDFELAIKCLGACLWYLKYSCIEDEILTMKKFEQYKPPDENYKEVESLKDSSFSRSMVLDGVTLLNLEIIESESGSSDGSLLEAMDYCSTPFGKRLFRQWICSPLCSPESIEDRLDAVEDLRSNTSLINEIVPLLKQLPDLHRLLSKIHTQGSARRNANHPDSRAIFYEEHIYSRRKIADFLLALGGFKGCLDVIHTINNSKVSIRSKLLKRCTESEDKGGHFPDIKPLLKFFENAFDHEKAKKDGKIIPSEDVDKEFDQSTSDIKRIKAELDDYLKVQQRHFDCKVTYFGTGKNRYQIEVPDHASKKASREHELQGQRKGFKRYWTCETKELLQELMAAEEHRETALKDIMRRIFAVFDKDIKKWEAAIDCISILDALLSLAQYSLNTGVHMCRPKVILPEKSTMPFLKICEGRHPALLKIFQDEDLVPNDIQIGTNNNNTSAKSNLVLVTGPNMGGKSTLMRQAGLIVIMAQMGSFVPVDSCEFTVVDRIFTRLGANDQIMEGESTFFVELSETVSILHHATKNSLVLMDELGRGTATFDGSAIAYSVVHELSEKIGCRSLFSTHYHCLVDEFATNPKVKLGHMSCMVENDTEDPDQETITFLYKFVNGSCPKSYGFNAAKLAGIPDEVIKVGRIKAQEFEDSLNRIKIFRTLFHDTSKVKEIKYM